MNFTKQKLAYQVTGEGPPVVLIHGLARTSDHWLGFQERLSSCHKVVTFDNRGIGASSQVPVKWNASIFQYAEDVVSVLDDLEIEHAHLVGVSLGGMVTLACGVKYPERCRSLSVVNSSIAESPLRLSPKGVLALAKAKLSVGQRPEEHLAKVLLSNIPEEKRVELTQSLQEVSWRHQPTAKLFLSQLIAAAKFYGFLGIRDIQVPTQIIVGTDDQFVPPVNSRRIHERIPDSKFIEIKDAGHEIWVERPELLSQVLLDFMRDV